MRWIGGCLAFFAVVACAERLPSSGEAATDLVQEVPAVDEAVADVPGDTGPDAAPETTPVDPVTAARLKGILDEYLAFAAEPGLSLSVIVDGNTGWDGAAGVADLTDGRALDRDSGFRVGSNTKPYVVVTVLQLAEEGRLGLDDPLSKTLPEYPAWADITLRQLMGMRSGIPDYLSDFGFWAQVLAEPGHVFAPADLLAYVKDKPLDFAPGKGCAYSNTGFVVLGLVIEKVTGHKAGNELRERIFTPLGLSHTFLDEGVEHPTLAHGYADPALLKVLTGAPMDVSALIPEQYLVGGLADLTDLYHPSLAWTAGAVVSTTGDAVRFVRALARGELLGKDSMDAMMDFGPCDLLGGKVQYGLGMIRYDTVFGSAYGHGGLFLGYEANAYYIPEKDLAVADLHNFVPSQWTAMAPEALRVAAGAAGTPPEVCRPPEGLFEPPMAEPFLEMRFRGTLVGEPAAAGIGSVRERVNGGEVRLSGLALSAKLANQAGKRVEISSSAPGPGGDAAIRSSVISIQDGVFASAGDDGILTSTEAGPYALFVAAGDVAVKPGTLEAERLCFTAVADPARAWRLATCGTDGFQAEAGGTVKVFGSIPLSTDPGVIEGTLKAILLSRCICPDGEGGWAACEPPGNGG